MMKYYCYDREEIHFLSSQVSKCIYIPDMKTVVIKEASGKIRKCSKDNFDWNDLTYLSEGDSAVFMTQDEICKKGNVFLKNIAVGDLNKKSLCNLVRMITDINSLEDKVKSKFTAVTGKTNPRRYSGGGSA